MKPFIYILIFNLYSNASAQILDSIRSPGTYRVGDTTIRVFLAPEFEEIEVFKDFPQKDSSQYKSYYFDTKTLKTCGTIRGYQYVGIWKTFNKKGEVIKLVDFEKSEINSFGQKGKFEKKFKRVKQLADEYLIKKFGTVFFSKHIQQNIFSSHYLGKDTSNHWFEQINYKPLEYSMTYDIKLSDGARFRSIEFYMDKKGRIKRDEEIRGLLSEIRDTFQITKQIAETIALTNGLTKNDSPLVHILKWTADGENDSVGNYEYIVAGRILREQRLGSSKIQEFNQVFIDPWTCRFISKEIGYNRISH